MGKIVYTTSKVNELLTFLAGLCDVSGGDSTDVTGLDAQIATAVTAAIAKALTSLAIEQGDTYANIKGTYGDNSTKVVATIPAMDADKAGLYTPTRHAAVLAAITAAVAPALTGIEVEQMDTYCRIWITDAAGNRKNIAQIPGMADDKAGLYTPTRHAAVLAAIAAAQGAADAAQSTADAAQGAAAAAQSTADSGITKIEVEMLDTFGRIWATDAKGKRTNIAQLPAMDDDKAGLMTPTRLAAITAAIAAAVKPVDTRLKAVEGLIEADADMTINKFNEIVNFLDGLSDQQTLEGIVADIAAQIAKVDGHVDDVKELLGDYADEQLTNAKIEAARLAPAYITLATAVSGVTVEQSGYTGTGGDLVYDSTGHRILLRVTPALVSPTSPVRYYSTWGELATKHDITKCIDGAGIEENGQLLPYPGRLYVFADTTGIWCPGADGALRKIADVCTCTASKDHA